jgi:hypothetical protein
MGSESDCSMPNGVVFENRLNSCGALNFNLGDREMTSEERHNMNALCARIQDEKDPKVFDELIRELNELFEEKHERINPHKVPEK